MKGVRALQRRPLGIDPRVITYDKRLFCISRTGNQVPRKPSPKHRPHLEIKKQLLGHTWFAHANALHQTLFCKSSVYVCRWCLLCLRTLGSQRSPRSPQRPIPLVGTFRVRASVTTAFGNETFSHIVPFYYLPCIVEPVLGNTWKTWAFLPYTMLLEFDCSTWYSSVYAFDNLMIEVCLLPRFWDTCSRNDFLESPKARGGVGALIVNFWRHLRQPLIFKGGYCL